MYACKCHGDVCILSIPQRATLRKKTEVTNPSKHHAPIPSLHIGPRMEKTQEDITTTVEPKPRIYWPKIYATMMTLGQGCILIILVGVLFYGGAFMLILLANYANEIITPPAARAVRHCIRVCRQKESKAPFDVQQ
jgi:hypothetical protein